MSKIKKFVTLMLAAVLLLGSVPIEPVLAASENEAVTEEVNEEITEETSLEEFSSENEIEEIESGEAYLEVVEEEFLVTFNLSGATYEFDDEIDQLDEIGVSITEIDIDGDFIIMSVPEGLTFGWLGLAEIEKENFVFDGWNTERDGSGIDIDEDIEITEDLEVYAQWEEDEDVVEDGVVEEDVSVVEDSVVEEGQDSEFEEDEDVVEDNEVVEDGDVVEDNVLNENNETGSVDEAVEDNESEASLEAMSTTVMPRPVVAASPVINTPFDEYTLSPGVAKPWIVEVSNMPVRPMMDIMYVVDTTGSMRFILPTVADTLSQFTEDLVEAGATDIHFGTAFFGDFDFDDPWFGITLPLGGHDIPTVQDAIRNLTPTGGGDAPEDPLWAHMRVIDETDWREDAQRVIILITDNPTKIRPDITVGGHPVTYEGAANITIENNIEAVLMSYGRFVFAHFSSLLGVEEHIWRTQADLERELRYAVIPPIATLNDYYVEARVISITYESDGTPSTDVSVEVDPDSFILRGGEIKEFDFTATPASVPNRFNDSTIVEIGFYVDGERVSSATQYLRFRVDAFSALHQFVSSDTDRDLPAEVLALLPADQTGLEVGSDASPYDFSPTTVSVGNGVWTFVGWDHESKVIVDRDVTFVGTWTWEYLEFDVLYEFESGTPDKDLPPEVIALRPSDRIGVSVGSVTPTDVFPTAVELNEGVLGHGIWTFEGWDPPRATIVDEDVTFTGTWTWEYVEFNVLHDFESEITDRDLPAEVLALLPDNQTGVRVGITVYPDDDFPQTVVINEGVLGSGVWTFVGWDHESQEIVDRDVMFVGTWTWRYLEFNVLHEFESGTLNRDLPAEVLALLPNDQIGVPVGTTVYPADDFPQTVAIDEGDLGSGEWTFAGWDYDSKNIVDRDVTFVGTWTWRYHEFDVLYEFESGTPDRDLPPEVLAMLPSDRTGFRVGTTVYPEYEFPSTVWINEGVLGSGLWTFAGWDHGRKEIINRDVTFVGTWTWMYLEFDVLHEFESGTPDRELPEEVLELLPLDQIGVRVGTTVYPDEDFPLTVELNEGVLGHGIWTFVGWDLESAIIVDEDVTFTGTWTWEYIEFNVFHEFESGTPDKELPVEVLELLPFDQIGVRVGTTVYPDEVFPLTIELNEGVLGHGIWTFEGWDLENAIVVDGDVIFTGIWVWEYITFNVRHEFVSGTVRELPAEIFTLLPAGRTGVRVGTTVLPTGGFSTTVIVEINAGYRIWTFEGWDPESATIVDEDIVFTGTWTYTEFRCPPCPKCPVCPKCPTCPPCPKCPTCPPCRPPVKPKQPCTSNRPCTPSRPGTGTPNQPGSGTGTPNQPSPGTPNQPSKPTLPQTGAMVGSTVLVGLALSISGAALVLKKRKGLK